MLNVLKVMIVRLIAFSPGRDDATANHGAKGALRDATAR